MRSKILSLWTSTTHSRECFRNMRHQFENISKYWFLYAESTAAEDILRGSIGEEQIA